MRSSVRTLVAWPILALSTQVSGQVVSVDSVEPPSAPQMAKGDFDDDGLVDLFVFGPRSGGRLWRNLGTGRFEDVTRESGLGGLGSPLSAEWHDYDRDGRPDLLLLLADGQVQLFRGVGAGLLRDATVDLGIDADLRVASASWVDYDGDGTSDLELRGRMGPIFLHGLGDGVFETVELVSESGAEPGPDGEPPAKGSSGSEALAAPGAGPSSGGEPADPGASGSARRRGEQGHRVIAATAAPGSPSGSFVGPGFVCADEVKDASGQQRCIPASSIPLIGHLFPLGVHFFVDAGGNVGVGTTSPPWRLSVASGSELIGIEPDEISSSSPLEIRTLGADPLVFKVNGNQEVLRVDPQSGAALSSPGPLEMRTLGPDPVVVKVQGSEEVMRIDPTSGIAVSSPGELELRTLGPNPLVLKVDASTEVLRVDPSSGTELSAPGTLELRSEAGSDISFAVGGESILTVDDEDRVLIRGGNESSTLGVHGDESAVVDVVALGQNMNAQLELRTAGSKGQSRIYFGDSADSHSGRIAYKHDGDYFSVVVDGQEMATVSELDAHFMSDRVLADGQVESKMGFVFPDGTVQTTAQLEGPPGASPWELDGSDTYYDQGKVGIGVLPEHPLHVSGTTVLKGRVGIGGDPTTGANQLLTIRAGGPNIGEGMIHARVEKSLKGGLSHRILTTRYRNDDEDGSEDWTMTVGGSGTRRLTFGRVARPDDGTPSSKTLLQLGWDGSVSVENRLGVGTQEPLAKLHVEGGDLFVRGASFDQSGDRSYLYLGDNANHYVAAEYGGGLRFGTLGAADALKIEQGTGEAEFSGKVNVDVLEIKGGSDIVESFETRGAELAPGTVVCVDPENPKGVVIAERAYDRRAIGVVSGAGGVHPGLRLGQAGVLDGDALVAVAGRVYVRSTAENGPIEAGDLLVSSDLPGHAMLADEPARAMGAVIGKAMSSLDEGTGLVLVLVNLQ